MNLAGLSSAIAQLDFEIANGQRINAEKDALEERIAKVAALHEDGIRMLRLYDTGLKIVSNRKADYKNARKAALEEDVSSFLNLAFPEENFKVQFHYSTRGTEELCTLRIGRPNHKTGEIQWGSPQCRSGDLNKQLLAYSIVATVALMLGSEVLLADEPLSSGDPITLSGLHPLFELLRERGLQLVIIEHKPEVYQHITRREILLEKDRSAGTVDVVYNGVVEADEIGNSEEDLEGAPEDEFAEDEFDGSDNSARSTGAAQGEREESIVNYGKGDSLHGESSAVNRPISSAGKPGRDTAGSTSAVGRSESAIDGGFGDSDDGDEFSRFRAGRSDRADRRGVFSSDGEIYLNT